MSTTILAAVEDVWAAATMVGTERSNVPLSTAVHRIITIGYTERSSCL
jgi:hypothetical protein